MRFEVVRPPRRSSWYEADLLEADDEHIVLMHDVFPSKPLIVKEDVVLAAGYRAVWFLYKNQPFDIGRFYRPDGSWTGYYVDILEPVYWEDHDPHTIRPLVDLFLDLWISPDNDYLVLDEDEFEEAVHSLAISAGQATHAQRTLGHLTEGIERRMFPPPAVRSFIL